MLQFFEMIRDLWVGIFNLFDSRPLQIGNFSVSYMSIVLAFLAIFIIISVFWKGARA